MRRPSAFFFFFNDTATTEIYTLSLHDALPISHHVHHLSDRRVHLPGHDARARLDRGPNDLGESGTGARGEQPEVARELAAAPGIAAQRPGGGRGLAHGLRELDAVAPLPLLHARGR